MNDLVSIILPTYNGVKYIKKAIESILNQSYSNWELLVIDDGSTDDTIKVVKELKVDYVISLNYFFIISVYKFALK